MSRVTWDFSLTVQARDASQVDAVVDDVILRLRDVPGARDVGPPGRDARTRNVHWWTWSADADDPRAMLLAGAVDVMAALAARWTMATPERLPGQDGWPVYMEADSARVRGLAKVRLLAKAILFSRP